MSLSVKVHTKDDCSACIDTKRLLNRKGIPHQTEHVAEDDLVRIEQIRLVASAKGVAPGMPFVEVIDDSDGTVEQWFGHRPDLILEHIIKKKLRG